MCPLYPLHLVITYGSLLFCLWIALGSSLVAAVDKVVVESIPKIRFLINGSEVDVVALREGESKQVTLYLDDLPPDALGKMLMQEESDDGLSHVEVNPEIVPLKYDELASSSSTGAEAGSFNVTGTFLGFSKVKLVLSSSQQDDRELLETQHVRVEVHRETKTLDIIFIHVVIGLVLIAYVNMGCAIHLDVIKETLKRPVAPAIGLATQYLFMPLVSYGVGYALFPSSPELWLGLFLTGCAPGGGGSNMWTYILGGSLDLSITMTFLSTVFAFAALPLWVFALGPSIFADGYFGKLPYRNIAALVFGLVVPCCIGLGIRRCCPKAADFLKKMLKPLSIFFIVFIMTFGVYAKFYLFSFFTWKVALAGFVLPFAGFLFGGTTALILRRQWEEVIAISIETGVQNTGLAIGVIKIAMKDFVTLGDIAIVLPVAVATMTPLPLFTAYIVKRLKERKSLASSSALDDKMESGCITPSNSNYVKDANDNNSKNILPL